MANTKDSSLSQATTLTAADLLRVITNLSTDPKSELITLANFITQFVDKLGDDATALAALADALGSPTKRYIGLVSPSGISGAAITDLVNTTGATITVVGTDGVHGIHASTPIFTANKTIIRNGSPSADTANYEYHPVHAGTPDAPAGLAGYYAMFYNTTSEVGLYIATPSLDGYQALPFGVLVDIEIHA